MSVPPPSFRYSNDAVGTSATAKKFTWENPVPVNSFWDSISYCTARNFLSNFSDPELEHLPISPSSNSNQETKLHLLLQLLKDKLAKEESATSPPQSLYEVDYKKWYSLWQGIFTYENELHLPEAEQTVRMLVAKNDTSEANRSKVVPPHMLADYLVTSGTRIEQFKEAEVIERPVCEWMDQRPHLGMESPQAINARRIIAKALWFQGRERREEAEKAVAELKGIVEGMGGGKFGMYQEEEKRLNKEMVAEIERRG